MILIMQKKPYGPAGSDGAVPGSVSPVPEGFMAEIRFGKIVKNEVVSRKNFFCKCAASKVVPPGGPFKKEG